MKSVFVVIVCVAAWASGQAQTSPPGTSPVEGATSRTQVDGDTASTLVLSKTPVVYPAAARSAGIQGKVELRVFVSKMGDVVEVSVVSGDPALAQAAVESVKQWKYKPYEVNASAVEMETSVSVNFQLKAPAPPTPPPLGIYRDDAYFNDYFGIYYPLSRDWVRETQLMRSKMATAGNPKGKYLLLAAVHIPKNSDPLRADSSFIVVAVNVPGAPSQYCDQYLQAVATNLRTQKQGQQKGDLTKFTIAGHDFYRGNFEYSHGVDHGAMLCTLIKDYLVRWEIVGWSKQAIETAVSTLQTITPVPPITPPITQQESVQSPTKKVQVPAGMSTGLLIKKVQPVYPPEARYTHIQGSVVLEAVINKVGDVVDLEVISGPRELVPSAVNAVRLWKYRPYLLNGEPVAVQTSVIVNYELRY